MIKNIHSSKKEMNILDLPESDKKSAIPALILPVSPAAKAKKEIVSPKIDLPPLKKTEFPIPAEISSPKIELPPLPKSLPPLKSKKKLPPISKLPPLPSINSPTVSDLPPIKPLKDVEVSIQVVSPLAKEVREHREEIIEQIGEEIEKKEKILGLTDEMKELMKPLKPLSALPVLSPPKEVSKTQQRTSLPSLPSLKKSALEIAQEGVETAKFIESEASFQRPPPVSSLKLPPIIPLKEAGKLESLSNIASPANLPSTKSRETTPKIRIPKIKSSPMKPSPIGKKSVTKGFGIEFPSTSTIVPQIPIVSPTAKKISKVSIATTSSEEVLQNIMKIDLSKLKSERSANKNSYSLNELKAIAGSLNLTKGGSKKEVVERIKSAILKVNPDVVFE